MQSSIEKLKTLENVIEKRTQYNRKHPGEIRKNIAEIRKNIAEIRRKIAKHQNEIRKNITDLRDKIGKNRKKNSNTQNKINQLPYHKIHNWIKNNQIESLESYYDSLSAGQYKSKKWLIEKLTQGKDMKKIIEKLKNYDEINDKKKLIESLIQEPLKEKLEDIRNEINNLPYHKIEQWTIKNQTESLESYYDSLSYGQIESKKWLIENLTKGDGLYIEIVGGWFGCPLIDLLNSKFNIKKIDFYEIDESCKKILAQYLNHFNFNFQVSVFGDFFERKELRRRDLIINTSSEHMEDIVKMKRYFKGNPVLAIQSNDYFDLDEHINCVHDVEELILKNEIRKVWYKGDLNFEKYTRFMAIGQWYD
jgi:hypothetical protein